MHLPRTLRRDLLLTTAAVTALSSCGSSSTTDVSPIAGSYSATTFRVTPPGQDAIDIAAQGGTLTLSIAADNSTSGALVIPARVTGVASLTASMAGTATQSGATVRFQQTADTFVRDLTWTVNGTALLVQNQILDGTSFTITLTRK